MIRYLSAIGIALGMMACLKPAGSDRPDGHRVARQDTVGWMDATCPPVGGALLLTRFHSMEDLRRAIKLSYAGNGRRVRLAHHVEGLSVVGEMRRGIREKDFVRARFGGFWDKLRVVRLSPYALAVRDDLARVEILGRRRPNLFGEGDVAFYDLAQAMVDRITAEDTAGMPARDLSEKGYLNTFNHVMAQAFMTSLYGEGVADFIADVHERDRMPELITGRFTQEQLSDLDNGPVDNYLDMVNNEWGQELGKALSACLGVGPHTIWTPGLLARYLNAILVYHSGALGIGFTPFRPEDAEVIKFAAKLNGVNADLHRLESLYW